MAFHKAKALQEAEKAVAQGKIAQAIKQYQIILDNDPSDLALLNTVGDLYIRDRNIPEGLRQFNRLAEAYVREGFNVKAIAIYRKISKVDPNSIETLVKLADLYQQQGLSREAREQYLQVADFYRRRNENGKVLEVLHKLVHLDPENLNFRARLATELERIGKLPEAAAIYLESAEFSLRRDDQAAADSLLQKAIEIDPRNSKASLLRARVAMARNQPAEVVSLLDSSAELQADPAARRLLLDAFIALRRIPESAKLVEEVFDANPSDLTPVSTVSWLLAETGQIDEAYRLADRVAHSPAGATHAPTILDILHQIRAKAPHHVPTLQLMYSIYERSADGAALNEILQALGYAHEQAGELEKAELAYQKLVDREPGEERCLTLLNGVKQKLGKEITTVDFSAVPTPIAEVEDLPPQGIEVDADQESLVREALENSDLFSRYNLAEKAIAELDKVLQIYPDQVEVHRRILEISRKGFPARGAAAATQLARIFRGHGDEELAAKYDAIAEGSAAEIPPAAQVPEPAPPPEFSLSAVSTEDSTAALPPPLVEVPPGESLWQASDTGTENATAPPFASALTSSELDLSDDLEALAKMIPEDPIVEVTDSESDIPVLEDALPGQTETFGGPPATAFIEPGGEHPVSAETAGSERADEPAPASRELEDGRVEVEFYLENDFFDEARQTIQKLETKFPGNALVAELKAKLDGRSAGSALLQAEPVQEASPPAPAAVSEVPHEIAAGAEVPAEPPLIAHPEAAVQNVSPSAPAAEEPVAVPETARGGVDLLGDLTGDLDASFAGFTAPDAAASAPVPVSATAAQPGPSPVDLTSSTAVLNFSPLSGLLAEMDESLVLAHGQDDPETHYNLGVAFREMGLLDESIGEFQKVVRGAGKGKYPANFLQACSLLAICFTEKKMPALAVRWYKRALETPDLDEEALMAIQYDLGAAYEQAGDARNALERFTEVYSQNIDFRDVAEKIRELQQKV
jgi:tetratricopeptide (TPR) repeat protein